jgi:hypothetical protein
MLTAHIKRHSLPFRKEELSGVELVIGVIYAIGSVQ